MDNQKHRTHLFSVRLWEEEISAGQSEWRGQVQHVLSGRTRYFRDWSTLDQLMLGMLSDAAVVPSQDDEA